MTTVVVTGAGGFLGRAVISRLRSSGCLVARLGRADGGAVGDMHIPIAIPVKRDDCIEALAKIRPALLIHLAAAAPSALPDDHVHVTRDFALTLFEAMAIAAPGARIVTIGSAAEFGAAVRGDRAMDEDDPCLPLSPYGAAKYSVTRHVQQGWLAGCDICVLRLFTLAGSNMPSHTVLGSAARQIHSLDARRAEIFLGCLEVERDYLDVEEASLLIVSIALRKERPPCLLNIASNNAFSIAAIVGRMIELWDRPCSLERIARPEDQHSPTRVIGDARKIVALGLHPKVPTVDELARRALGLDDF